MLMEIRFSIKSSRASKLTGPIVSDSSLVCRVLDVLETLKLRDFSNYASEINEIAPAPRSRLPPTQFMRLFTRGF